MFTIYRKTVGDRVFDRYYREWKNAQKELEKEFDWFLENGASAVTQYDDFNTLKGLWVFEKAFISGNGEPVTLSLIGGYFTD